MAGLLLLLACCNAKISKITNITKYSNASVYMVFELLFYAVVLLKVLPVKTSFDGFFLFCLLFRNHKKKACQT